MERKAEDENARARTEVRNQTFSSSPTEDPKATTLARVAQQNTPRSAHTGEKSREKVEREESWFEEQVYLPINHVI